jgi:hypothetical protein
MPQKDDDASRQSPRAQGTADARKARLAEQLRANLQRRKAQARWRRAGEADQRPEGLAPADPSDRE